jgi:sirohydrochlorin ferrochelatase
VALSADGASLYVSSTLDDSIARFARNTTNGKLSYKGCITGETASGAPGGTRACDPIGSATSNGAGSGLDDVRTLTLSPDGTSLYVVSLFDDAVARFGRNTTTGKLTYKDCVTGETESGPAGSGACTAVGSATSIGTNSGLDTPESVAVSADGGSLYVGAAFDDAVARFDRNATSGKLSYKGCITGETQSGAAGSGACDAIGTAASLGANSGLDQLTSVTLSPDGASLYITSLTDDAIARFTRNTTSGKLSYRDCVTGETESGPAGSGACDAIGTATALGANSGLDAPKNLALSSNGASLYANARDDDAVARFNRNTTSGKLLYKSCVTGETESGSAGSGACKRIGSAVSGGASSGLDAPEALVVSPDDASLYAVAPTDDAIARFTRAP